MPNIYLQMMREVYPNFRNCLIQTFDDNKERKDGSLAKIINQNKYTDEQMDGILERANQKGCGIFFSVNSMNGSTRNKESVTNINAWVCEVDDKPKEEQMKLIGLCPLKPSLIVESQKSYHMYRFAKDGTKENWNKICWGLCNFFGGDVAIPKNEAVVLRVPGFKHLKNPNEPFDLAIVDGNKEYYTEEEMLGAYSNTTTDADRAEQKRKVELENQKLKKLLDNDDTRERINAMDAMTMLSEISGSSMVNGEMFDFRRNSDGSYQILINGEAHGSRIDKLGKIGSYDRGGPSWVCWVLWYGVYTAKDIYQWVKEHHSEVLPEKKEVVEAKNIDDILSAINTDVNTELHTYYYPKGFEKFNSFLSGELVTIVAPSNSGKTTFAMDIIKRNTAEGRKCFYINGEFKIETVWVNRWLWKNGKTKESLGDKNPLTPEERKDMENYVANCLGQFGYDCSPMGYKLEDLVELITEKTKEGYELFVIDSLSKIQGNLTNEARSHQNQTMETFLALVQKLNIAVILLHHTNKFGKFEGSQKIFDFSNVFITMKKCDEDFVKIPSRTFKLEKDKYVSDVELEMYYDIKTGTYTESLSEISEMRRNDFNY